MEENKPTENTPEAQASHLFKFDLNKITKTNITNTAKEIVKSVEEGWTDPVKEYLKAKAMNETSGEVIDLLKPYVMKEMGGQKSLRTHGLEISLSNGAKKYDYSHDSKWQKLKAAADEAANALKAHEELMRKAMDFEGVCGEGGEVIEPAHIVNYGADVLKTIIPK